MTHELMSHEPVASNIDLLSAWIESQMAYSGQPGLSIAIIRDQDIVWSKGRCVRDSCGTEHDLSYRVDNQTVYGNLDHAASRRWETATR